jgi:exodeoxyribonuclease-3
MRETSPDIVCLQELKATDAEFPIAAIRDAGYEAIWRGQKTWNGVAILARMKPIQTLSDLPGDPNDKQSRYIEAAVNGIVVASLYAPNGNPQPGPKFDYKLAWLRRLSVHAAELLAARVPVVLAGDYNVVPTDQDIYPSKSWDKDALVQPASRAAFAELTQQGWVDAVRALHPSEPMYTFWHYLRNRWQRNAGLRIDHVLLSPPAADRLQAAGVDRAVRGQPDASDHAPVWVGLSDQNGRRQRPRAGGKSSSSSSGRGQTTSGPTRPSKSRPLLVTVVDTDPGAGRDSGRAGTVGQRGHRTRGFRAEACDADRNSRERGQSQLGDWRSRLYLTSVTVTRHRARHGVGQLTAFASACPTALCSACRTSLFTAKSSSLAWRAIYRHRISQHLEIGLKALEKLKSKDWERLHSRKLRSFLANGQGGFAILPDRCLSTFERVSVREREFRPEKVSRGQRRRPSF